MGWNEVKSFIKMLERWGKDLQWNSETNKSFATCKYCKYVLLSGFAFIANFLVLV